MSIKNNQRGFSTIWLLGFAGLILLIGLGIFDITRVYIEREKLISAADASANAGASAIDESYLGTDSIVRLDSSEAPLRCKNLLLKYGSPGGDAESVLDVKAPTKTNCVLDSSDPDQRTIIATASGEVKFSFLFSVLGFDSKEITVSSRARPSCSDNSC